MAFLRLGVNGGNRVDVGVPEMPNVVGPPLHGRRHGQVRRDGVFDGPAAALSLQGLVEDVHVVRFAVRASASRREDAGARCHLDVSVRVDGGVVRTLGGRVGWLADL